MITCTTCSIKTGGTASGKRASNFRSHVLGLRLRKVAQVTGSFAAWHPAGAKEYDFRRRETTRLFKYVIKKIPGRNT